MASSPFQQPFTLGMSHVQAEQESADTQDCSESDVPSESGMLEVLNGQAAAADADTGSICSEDDDKLSTVRSWPPVWDVYSKCRDSCFSPPEHSNCAYLQCATTHGAHLMCDMCSGTCKRGDVDIRRAHKLVVSPTSDVSRWCGRPRVLLCAVAVDEAHTVRGGDSEDAAGVSSSTAHGGRPAAARAAGASGVADRAGSPPGLAADTDGRQRDVGLISSERGHSRGHRDLAGAEQLCVAASDDEPVRLRGQLQEGQLHVGVGTRHATRCVPASIHCSLVVGLRNRRWGQAGC